MGYAVAPKALAASLKRVGVGVPETLDRLALSAETASLRDKHYIGTMRAKVITEREKWNSLFDALNPSAFGLPRKFRFFETGHPHQDIAAALGVRGREDATLTRRAARSPANRPRLRGVAHRPALAERYC
jgi:histidinol-phosphate aminotransferase